MDCHNIGHPKVYSLNSIVFEDKRDIEQLLTWEKSRERPSLALADIVLSNKLELILFGSSIMFWDFTLSIINGFLL